MLTVKKLTPRIISSYGICFLAILQNDVRYICWKMAIAYRGDYTDRGSGLSSILRRVSVNSSAFCPPPPRRAITMVDSPLRILRLKGVYLVGRIDLVPAEYSAPYGEYFNDVSCGGSFFFFFYSNTRE